MSGLEVGPSVGTIVVSVSSSPLPPMENGMIHSLNSPMLSSCCLVFVFVNGFEFCLSTRDRFLCPSSSSAGTYDCRRNFVL